MLAIRVAVVRGGPSSEYEISMSTGAGVLNALRELGYHTKDIIISKKGEWLDQGMVRRPEVALLATDVVFIAMHGAYGEDGTIQKILERFHIPFTGSNSFPSSVAFNKDTTKRALRDHNIKTPKHLKVTRENSIDCRELAKILADSFGPEYVLKPTNSGSSHGVVMVPNAAELAQALSTMFSTHEEFMVEERIRGVEATVAVLEQYRDEDLYILPPIEIIPPSNRDFFAEDVKYTGETTELCPGRFSFAEKDALTDLASRVHTALGLSQYSRSDFMVRRGEVFFLEVNTLPGLTPQSLFPKAAESVGLSFAGLVDHLVRTAKVY